MKKCVFRISVVLVLLCIVLNGCSSNGTKSLSKDATKQIFQSNEKVKIKVWARGSGPDEGVNAIVSKFNSSQSQAIVSYEYFGDNYANVIKTALAAAEPPDIFEINSGLNAASLVREGMLVSLDDIITPELKAKFHPDTFKAKEYLIDGKIYSVPVRISAYRLLYNKDIFKKAGLNPEKPPATLEEMRKMAKQITDAGNGEFYGFAIPLALSDLYDRIIDPINIGMGVAGRYGFDFKTGKFDFSSNKRLLSYYLQLLRDGVVFPGYTTLGIDPLRVNFSQGKVGMYIDGNWMVGNYGVILKTAVDWDCAPLPVFEGSRVGKYWAEIGVPWGIAKLSKNVDISKKFYLAWLEGQDSVNRYMPAPRTYLESNKEDNLPIKELNLKAVKGSFETKDLGVFVVEPQKFISLEGDNRNKVFTALINKAMANSSDVSQDIDSAITDLNKRYNAALESALNNGFLNQKDVKIENFDPFNY